MVKKTLMICLAVSTEYQHKTLTDRRTQTSQHSPRYAYASRSKNVTKIFKYGHTNINNTAKIHAKVILPRDAMHKRDMPSCGVCPSVRHVRVSVERNKHFTVG